MQTNVKVHPLGYFATLQYLGDVWNGASYGYLEAWQIHTFDCGNDFQVMQALRDDDVRVALRAAGVRS